MGHRRESFEFRLSLFCFQASFFRDAEGLGQPSSNLIVAGAQCRVGRRGVRTPRRGRGGEAHTGPLRIPIPPWVPTGSLHGCPRGRKSSTMAGTALLGVGWLERGS